MTRDELVKRLEPVVGELNSDRVVSKQSIINKYLQLFNECVEEGVSVRNLSEIMAANLKEEIKLTTLSTMLRRAKESSLEKKKKLTISPRIESEPRKEIKQNSNPISSETEVISKYNDSDWHGVNVTSKPLMKRLERLGFNPSEVRSWNLVNEQQISNRLVELSNQKGK